MIGGQRRRLKKGEINKRRRKMTRKMRRMEEKQDNKGEMGEEKG